MLFSISELQIYKDQLLALESSLVQKLNRHAEADKLTNPDDVNDSQAIDTDIREEIEHMEVEAEMKELKKRLDDVRIALKKIENGTYGLSEKTGKPIDLQRLQMYPDARINVGE